MLHTAVATVTPYFNRPGHPVPLDELRREIREARYCLAIASAWLTDDSVVDAAIESKAASKYFILNRSDVDRAGDPRVRASYRRLAEHTHGLAVDLWRRRTANVPPPCLGAYAGIDRTYDARTMVLGGASWREGVMHHKFVLIDHASVWAGSYNLTLQARSNYETLLRIEDEQVSIAFWAEVGAMVRAPDASFADDLMDFATSQVVREDCRS